MDVIEAIRTRQSCRQFTDQAVSEELVREILDTARWAPSGSNVQPWHIDVLAGAKRQELVDRVQAQDHLFPKGEGTEYHIHVPGLVDPYKARRWECAEDMYASVDIPREDRAGRIGQYVKNLDFFGAPVGLMFSIDRMMDVGSWADMGILIQSIMLTARGHGLHTCPQQIWAMWHKTVTEILNIPDNRMLYCGMALGYMAEDQPINQWRTTRQEVDEFTTFAGFDDPNSHSNEER